MYKTISYLRKKSKIFRNIYDINEEYSSTKAYLDVSSITYYGYVALFPLILITLTIIRLVFLQNSLVHESFIRSIKLNFPIVSNDLPSNIHSLKGYGVGLVISIVVAIYGSLGLGQAIIDITSKVLKYPYSKRNLLINELNRIKVVLCVGFIFILSGLVASYIGFSSRYIFIKVLLLSLDLLIIYLGILSLIYIISPKNFNLRKLQRGTLLSAFGILSTHIFGSFIITHDLAKANWLYGVFSLSLILLFWIFLISRIYIYGLLYSRIIISRF